MSPESFDLAHAWFKKARSDLQTARLLIQGGEKHLDTGCYHCQQAVEKALKGWLTAREILFPKSHYLVQLLELCVPADGGFAEFRPHCEELSPFAQEFRYPGDVADPQTDQAQHALQLTEEIFLFVSERMDGLQP